MTELETTAEAPAFPQLNKPAPDFCAPTTAGIKKLSDYEGKWLILFSHPADFTPVCSTEFMAFAKAYDQFKEMNCELLGLSIDSVHSHIAWVRSIKENWGIDIQFPIIDDIPMTVAKAYGMIHPGASDTSAVRATFLIDPKGILRAMVYYPMSNGRSILNLFVCLLPCKRLTPTMWQHRKAGSPVTRSLFRRHPPLKGRPNGLQKAMIPLTGISPKRSSRITL